MARTKQTARKSSTQPPMSSMLGLENVKRTLLRAQGDFAQAGTKSKDKSSELRTVNFKAYYDAQGQMLVKPLKLAKLNKQMLQNITQPTGAKSIALDVRGNQKETINFRYKLSADEKGKIKNLTEEERLRLLQRLLWLQSFLVLREQKTARQPQTFNNVIPGVLFRRVFPYTGFAPAWRDLQGLYSVAKEYQDTLKLILSNENIPGNVQQIVRREFTKYVEAALENRNKKELITDMRTLKNRNAGTAEMLTNKAKFSELEATLQEENAKRSARMTHERDPQQRLIDRGFKNLTDEQEKVNDEFETI